VSWTRRLEARLHALLPLGVLERAAARPVLGVFYHVVSEERLPHVAPLYRYKTPAQFEADLAWLSARYRFVTAAEVEAEGVHPRGGRPAVHLSFDDGFAECFRVVRPILLRMGIPCTFFLIDGALDNRLLPAPNLAALCMEAAGRRGMKPRLEAGWWEDAGRLARTAASYSSVGRGPESLRAPRRGRRGWWCRPARGPRRCP
jgi:hypothetical protein